MKSFILFILITCMPPLSACEFLKTDPDVLMVQNFIKTEGDLNEYWPQYDLRNKTVVLTRADFDNKCLIVLRPGQELLVGTSKLPLKIGNGLYTFINEMNQPEGNFSDILKELGVTSAYIADVSDLAFHYGDVGNFMDKKEKILGLLIHEGFHFFIQGEGAAPWKTWKEYLHLDRDEMAKCYQNETFSEESLSLEKLSDATIKEDHQEMKNNLKSYFDLRHKRYASTKDIVIKGLYGSRDLNCQEAEREMEFLEGIPDFVASSSLLNLKILGLEDFRMNNKASFKTFYAIGLTKMLALKTSLKNRFIPELTSMLADPDQDLDSLLKKTFDLH